MISKLTIILRNKYISLDANDNDARLNLQTNVEMFSLQNVISNLILLLDGVRVQVSIGQT